MYFLESENVTEVLESENVAEVLESQNVTEVSRVVDVEAVTNRLIRMGYEIVSLQDKVAALENTINHIKKQQTMIQVKSKPSSLESMGTPEFSVETGGTVFEYVWVIDNYENFTDLYQEDDYITSPRFYIGPRSYRMFMSMYPIGSSTKSAGFLEYLNIFAGVARGAYDDIQTWPFSLRYDLILLDQSEDDHENLSVTVWPGFSCGGSLGEDRLYGESILDRYQSNSACGTWTLVERETLNTRNYLKDGKLMIKIKVYFN